MRKEIAVTAATKNSLMNPAERDYSERKAVQTNICLYHQHKVTF